MNPITKFFIGMRSLDALVEYCESGIFGGIQRFNIPPNNVNFGTPFLKAFIEINKGNNDFDYEIGRIGYRYLTSNDGLRELCDAYLKAIPAYRMLPQLHENVMISLQSIRNQLAD